MKKINIDIRFQGLQASLNKIKALLAWQQLQQKEVRPNQPPGFIIQDSTVDDLRNEYTLFLARAQEIHYILNHKNILPMPEDKRQKLNQQLFKLEDQVKALRATEKFIKL